MDMKRHLLAERGLAHWQDWTGSDKSSFYELVHDACGRWIRAIGSSHGFTVCERGLSVDAYTQHRGKSGELRFSSVDFSGEVTVVDAESFARALTHGIGHAKAFGSGLLLVRRLGRIVDVSIVEGKRAHSER